MISRLQLPRRLVSGSQNAANELDRHLKNTDREKTVLNQVGPAQVEEHKPNILRFSIGNVLGIITPALGTFVFTDLLWLRIVLWVLGAIQLIVSLAHTPQVVRSLHSK